MLDEHSLSGGSRDSDARRVDEEGRGEIISGTQEHSPLSLSHTHTHSHNAKKNDLV